MHILKGIGFKTMRGEISGAVGGTGSGESLTGLRLTAPNPETDP